MQFLDKPLQIKTKYENLRNDLQEEIEIKNDSMDNR